jgi:pyrrolysine biosynthesis protein PylC
MKVAVVGGKLQGIEACYLASRIGWDVTLIDRNPCVPASGLCGGFVCIDILREPAKLAAVIRDVDLIIPAMEDPAGLQCLSETAAKIRTPLALDPHAYAVTSSKKESDRLFRRLGLSAPRPWPDSNLPVMVKPVESSGSKGVGKISDPEALTRFLETHRSSLHQWVIQEYLEGPSYSLEIIGLQGQCVTLQVTALEMDATFDCKRVLAPVDLPVRLDQEFREAATTLGQNLRLNGVMDLEVVLHEGRLKLLEIDARLPSQTPSVVARSTGINILELVGTVFLESRLPEALTAGVPQGVIYEHIRVSNGRLEVSGEHIMAQAGPLHTEEGFFGADMALTNYTAPDRPWVATLVISGQGLNQAWEKRGGVIQAIMERCGLADYEDPSPVVPDG